MFTRCLHVLAFAAAVSPCCAQETWSDEFALHDTDGGVYALQYHDDGSGRSLYVAGEFSRAGVTPCRGVAHWVGHGWLPLGAGVEGRVLDMASMTIDGAPALVVAGELITAGGAPTEGVAVWMDGQWSAFSAGSALGPGVTGRIDAIEVVGGPSGDRLVVGGELETAGGVSTEVFASWDGESWADLSDGIGDEFQPLNLALLDLFGSTALYAVGTFERGAFPSSEPLGPVVRLDGTSWTAIDEPPPWSLWPSPGRPALAVFETVEGEALYAATTDRFSRTGPGDEGSLARWNGEEWDADRRHVRNDLRFTGCAGADARRRPDPWQHGIQRLFHRDRHRIMCVDSRRRDRAG